IINSNVNKPVNKPSDKTPAQSTTTPTDLKVELGSEPNTLIVNFPAGTKENVVIAALGPLGLSIIRSDVVTGRYLFALPKVSVFIERGDGPDASDKAWINFPRIYSAEDIDTYFGKNNLKIDRWSLDPETGDRFAVVDLPRLEAKLIDPEQGLYTITLMPTDQESLDAWARESGVRIIQYDAKTGETLVQPIDWKAPTIVGNEVAPAPTSAPTAAPAKITSPAPARTPPPASELVPGVDRNGRAGWWSADGTFWVPNTASPQPSAAPKPSASPLPSPSPTPAPSSTSGAPAPKHMSLIDPASAARAEDPSPSPAPTEPPWPTPSPSPTDSPSPSPSPSDSPSPSPSPSAPPSPSPSPSESPSPAPSPSESASPSPSPSASPSASPSPSASASPSPSPSASPSASPSPSESASPSPSPSASPSASPSPSPSPSASP